MAAGYRIDGGDRLGSKMPGGRRTDRISQRDLEVLEFVARFGVVPRGAVGIWAGTARAVTAARERRLREAGLIEVLSGFGDSGRIVVCQRAGLRAVCREELPTPAPSPASLVHSAASAHVAAQLERKGHRVLSEREIAAIERAEGKRIYSAERRERFHRPDLVLLDDSPVAIEVELTAKSPRRLQDILRAWRWTLGRNKFGLVRYLCSPRAFGAVERAADRVSFDDGLEIERLVERRGRWVIAGRKSPFAPASRAVPTRAHRDAAARG